MDKRRISIKRKKNLNEIEQYKRGMCNNVRVGSARKRLRRWTRIE